MPWNEPLQLQYWLVQVLSGGTEVFTFLSIIFIAFLSAYFRMLNVVTLVMFLIYAMMMSAYFKGIYFLIILIVGLVISYTISKLIKS